MQPRHHTTLCKPNSDDAQQHSELLEDALFQNAKLVNEWNHDTIGTVAVDSEKNVAAACSTNGMTYRVFVAAREGFTD